ncbi:GntR family transcriptional regulator [Rossellomorea sp. GCM10028870]|uniref:GntR family transcriptional regulator n=1 Tax=unclassified Rossellomorea TaxID=2837526 RepID=UPI0030E251F8
MFIQIESQSVVPIYAQVRNGIMEGIVRGELVPGDVLPSVRALAADLGVNMHTVNKSYHELESKGVIQIVPKSGAVICPPSVDGIASLRIDQISGELRPILVESLVLGMKEDDIKDLVTSIISKVKGE